MPWCPKCKNEYKEGYTVCADCGCELVESLANVQKPVYFGDEEELQHIGDFLQSNGITTYTIAQSVNKDGTPSDNLFELLTDSENEAAVKRCIQVYLQNFHQEDEEENPLTSPDDFETTNKAAMKRVIFDEGRYEDQAKKAEEYKSGAYTLLLVGIVGIVCLILLEVGIIPINLPSFTNKLILIVMGALFVLFIVLGITSFSSYKKLLQKADEDGTKKDQIINWIKDSITADAIDSYFDTTGLSDEELYFKRTDRLKELILTSFPDSDEAFIDYLIEDQYSSIFDQP